ncbi:MAG TPA: ATP-binding cassette domain-containing protein, partial [Candidatus Aminicenantes bacterium]|nr:ATP-binding cassette domain-containing protein [Candidatus Aminicenantes bacterium]
VWEEAVAAGGKADDLQRRNLLGAFLFSGDDVQKKVEVLSGGEKSRLALLRLLLQASNCLILDEPTNHLDSKTREVFQRALRGYGGTVVIVSHDRSFLDSLVTRVLELREGRVTDYPGNYTEFISHRAARAGTEPASDPTTVTGAPSAAPELSKKELRRQEAERRNLWQSNRRALLKEIAALEGEITALEAEKSALENSLCDPAFLADSSRIGPAMVALKRATETLKGKMACWEEKMARLETLDREASRPS